MDMRFLLDVDYTLCSFKSGELLISQGEPVAYIYYLLEGTVSRIEYNLDGEDVIFNTKKAGHDFDAVVGLNDLWSPDNRSVSSFVAETNLRCARINADIARQALDQHPEIYRALLTKNMVNYLRLRDMFNFRRDRRVPAQICDLLLHHIEETPDGMVIPKSLTNVSISRLLGVHQVTVCKTISVLKKEAIVERTPLGLQVKDIEALTDYATWRRMDF